jgi:hypothetical protein
MTISITGSASGTPDHTLVLSGLGDERSATQCPGSFSATVWQGHPVLLTEGEDSNKFVIAPITSAATFKFTKRQIVIAPVSPMSVDGIVIGRADYANGSPNSYLVRHFDAHGDQVERWYEEDQLAAR